MRGVVLITLKEWMGYHSVVTTEIYAHVCGAHRAAQADRLAPPRPVLRVVEAGVANGRVRDHSVGAPSARRYASLTISSSSRSCAGMALAPTTSSLRQPLGGGEGAVNDPTHERGDAACVRVSLGTELGRVTAAEAYGDRGVYGIDKFWGHCRSYPRGSTP